MRDKDIGFLVNCVDESLNSPHSLIEMPEQSLLDLVNKNVAVATLMTRLVLPGMVERSRGAVVNISSGVCCRPLPRRVTLVASTVRKNPVDINHFLPEYSFKSSIINVYTNNTSKKRIPRYSIWVMWSVPELMSNYSLAVCLYSFFCQLNKHRISNTFNLTNHLTYPDNNLLFLYLPDISGLPG